MKMTSIFKNRTFMLLLAAGAFAILGYSTFLTTTTWYVVTELGSASSLGIVLVSATVPRILMMTFGGILADKYKKTTIMFGTNLIQSILLLIMFVLISTDTMTLGYLIAIAIGFGMLDAFFGPASSSMIPKVVEKEQLQQANAYFQGIDQFAFIAGPIVAGLVMEGSGISTSILVATILVFLSAVIIFPPFIREASVDRSDKNTPWQDLREGFSYISKKSYLMTGILVLITLNFFAFGSLQIAIPLLVEIHDGTPINLSIMEVSLAFGMIVSTVILGKVKIKRRGLTSILGLVATLISLVIFSQGPNLIVLSITVFFMGFAMSYVYIPFFTAAQEGTDNRIMGRVMSIIFLAMNGFDPIAYGLVSGLVSSNMSIQTVMLSSAILGIIVTGIITLKARNYVRS
ncbi:Major Facilitator Superfamily protein [Terribacillus aidingensis]|uniref:Major Facilitator Superfamily protein n=1 Tax=Terribacillus aidingensis TaxID=586416 RepID=A0A285NQM3_9BACI|nr:MFS transporter [Terribacillus aidingensis]SNZ10166.1 Major Facilitator Superfamily protein [Terribacillus aidingensis]